MPKHKNCQVSDYSSNKYYTAMTINNNTLKTARNIPFATYLQHAKVSALMSLTQFKERKKKSKRERDTFVTKYT